MPTTIICQILTCMHKHVMAVFMLKHLNIMAFQVTSDDAEINAYKFTAKHLWEDHKWNGIFPIQAGAQAQWIESFISCL